MARIREFLVRIRQGELKYGPAWCIHVCPQPAPMGIDDRSTDRQSHPYSARLRGVESLENAIETIRINARTGIAHRHENATGRGLLGADRQLSWPRLDRVHGFDRVQDQVQHHLLQLNTIPLDGK
jgi:hypothetical protein